jgi:hypothetical protein
VRGISNSLNRNLAGDTPDTSSDDTSSDTKG